MEQTWYPKLLSMSIHADPVVRVRRRRSRSPKGPNKHRPVLFGIYIVDGLGLLHQIAAIEKALMLAIGNVRNTILAFCDIH